MSDAESNSGKLLGAYDAWNRKDCDAWLAYLAPEVVISTSGVFPDLSAEYCGHGEATRFWRQMHAPWETFRIDVEHVEDDDEYAFAAIRFSGKGVDSGIEVDMRFGMGTRIGHDGLATHLVNRRTLEEAREVLKAQEPDAASQPA
ncbi:MAG TPA: nuclear transport factor 2 family protein [Thermoleophilaceae bacterium]|nr:nuclear transport factor 2 family protein [Thermoleophilaceae bacterium]